MKKRAGFVSNSSSASYYVTILEPPQEALEKIGLECSWPYTGKEFLIERLERRITSLKDRLDYIDNRKDTFFLSSKEYLEVELKKTEEMLTEVKKITDPFRHRSRMIEIALESYNIEVDKEENSMELKSSTAMHNSYTEGMPDLLKDIALYYSFENESKIRLRVEHRG